MTHLNILLFCSFQVKSHHHLNSPCYPCLPHRCHLFPKRPPLYHPNTAANMATTIITITTSTRRKRRSTSTNTSTSANMKARTRKRIETGTTPMPIATAQLVADPCAHHLCLTRAAMSFCLSGYIHQSAPEWRLESKTSLLDLIIHNSSVLCRKIHLDKIWEKIVYWSIVISQIIGNNKFLSRNSSTGSLDVWTDLWVWGLQPHTILSTNSLIKPEHFSPVLTLSSLHFNPKIN